MAARYTFNKGDAVIRRPGTLGADGERGTIVSTRDHAGYQMVTVQFPSGRRECFAADTFVRAHEQ